MPSASRVKRRRISTFKSSGALRPSRCDPGSRVDLFGHRWARDYPESAPIADSGARELQVRFGRDGFTVRYRFTRGQVTILRVFHGRQQR